MCGWKRSPVMNAKYMIWSCAGFWPFSLLPARQKEISVAGTIGQERFTAKGSIIRKAGWRQVYDSDWQDMDEMRMISPDRRGRDSFGLSGSTQTLDQDVSSLRPGSILPVTALAITKGSTKPPAYFTEGTLVAAMENPVKYLKNKNKTIVRTLGETGGLGTVATRADIIEKLFNSFLMEKKGNEIHITSKGETAPFPGSSGSEKVRN